ncbi:MAG: uroporphyrinogen-III synthase [Pseudomonadales bacterium]
MSEKNPQSLAGPQGRVLVTRPAVQSAELVDALQLAGWQVQALPMLVVEPLPLPSLAADLRSLFVTADAAAAVPSIAIFISANAVQCSAGLLRTLRLAWPNHLYCCGIGAATLAAIEAQGWPLLPLVKTGHDTQSSEGQGIEEQGIEEQSSEALLARLQAIDLARARVLLFCGQGGRNILQRSLAERGAQVQRIETYRRLRPDYSAAAFAQSMHSFLHRDSARGERAAFMPVMMFASTATVENFCFFARASAYWQQLVELPALLPSARVAGDAAALGLRNAVVAGNASTQAFLRALARLPHGSRCKL